MIGAVIHNTNLLAKAKVSPIITIFTIRYYYYITISIHYTNKRITTWWNPTSSDDLQYVKSSVLMRKAILVDPSTHRPVDENSHGFPQQFGTSSLVFHCCFTWSKMAHKHGPPRISMSVSPEALPSNSGYHPAPGDPLGTPWGTPGTPHCSGSSLVKSLTSQ